MENELISLFEIPGVLVQVPTIWLLKKCMKDEERLFNAHLMVRYKVVDEIFTGRTSGWLDIYNEMQRKRVSQISIIPKAKADNEKAFRDLIYSFSVNGFDSNYPILVNRRFSLVNGSHRLAIALYFHCKYVYITMNRDTFDMEPDYSINWFIENGFDSCTINAIRNTYLELIT